MNNIDKIIRKHMLNSIQIIYYLRHELKSQKNAF